MMDKYNKQYQKVTKAEKRPERRISKRKREKLGTDPGRTFPLIRFLKLKCVEVFILSFFFYLCKIVHFLPATYVCIVKMFVDLYH